MVGAPIPSSPGIKSAHLYLNTSIYYHCNINTTPLTNLLQHYSNSIIAVSTVPGRDDGFSSLPDPQTTKILIGEVNIINSTVIKKMLEKYP